MPRLITIALLAILCVGRPASGQKRCYTAHGNAVWVERHFRAIRSADGLSPVAVRWKADTSSQRQGSPGQTTLLIRTNPDRGARPSARYTITEATPAVARLAPGSYNFWVLGITYEHTSLDIDVLPNDSIVLDVRLRRGDYCEETITIQE